MACAQTTMIIIFNKGNTMKHKSLVMGLLVLMFITQSVLAKSTKGYRHRTGLNTVMVNMSEEQWVKTDTAKLTVSINATLNNKNLASFRAMLLKDLNTIANGSWHMTEFNRSQDSSGLAKLFAKASIRLKQNALTNVYQKARAISKAGLQYRISNIDFTPSFSEMNAARSQLRESIYKKITLEIEHLNATYPKQAFTLHKIVFSEAGPLPMTNAAQPLMLARSAKMAPSSETSYQLTLHALVIMAANRQFS